MLRKHSYSNIYDDDPDILYSTLNRAEDGVDPNHNHAEIAGVDGENKEGAINNNYDPEQDIRKPETAIALTTTMTT